MSKICEHFMKAHPTSWVCNWQGMRLANRQEYGGAPSHLPVHRKEKTENIKSLHFRL